MHQRTYTLALALLVAGTALTGCIGGGDDEPATSQNANERDRGGADQPGGPAGQAGNAGTAGAGPNASQDRTNASAAFFANATLSSCILQLGLIPLPEPLFGEFAPDGWETSPFQDLPGFIEGFAAALDCDEGAGPNGTTGETNAIVGGLIVGPPIGLRGADVHALTFGIFLEEGPVHELLRAWGVRNLDTGPTTVDDVATPAARAGYAEGISNGFGVRLVTNVPASPFELGSSSIRLFELNDGRVRSAVDFAWRGGSTLGPGPAVLTVGEQGLPTEPFPSGLAVHIVGDDLSFEVTPALVGLSQASGGSGAAGNPSASAGANQGAEPARTAETPDTLHRGWPSP